MVGVVVWSAQDDIDLHRMKSSSIASLAAHFNRGAGAIKSRLKHLCDPEHKAYQRLHTTGASGLVAATIATGASVFALPAAKKLKVGDGTEFPAGTSTGKGAILVADASSSSAGAEPSAIIAESSLTPSQRAIARQAIDSGGNVFLTGAAGVGKSYVLRFIVEQLKLKHPSAGAVAVTASTGAPAALVFRISMSSHITLHLSQALPRCTSPAKPSTPSRVSAWASATRTSCWGSSAACPGRAGWRARCWSWTRCR